MNKEKMETGKILPLLVELSVPAMIGMIVNAIYNIVDRMFIGNAPHLGSIGLAGIISSNTCINGVKFNGRSWWCNSIFNCFGCKAR